MKLCMIGTGYVGLVSGVCFSDLGNDVICVDKDHNKINNLKHGIIPIYEPGLEELVNKNYKNKKLRFSTDLANSIRKSDIIFICLGTPSKKNSDGADLGQIYSVAKEISKLTKDGKLISVAGGGDTVAALSQSNYNRDFTYISTAGGAFLEYLEGKDLPGLSVLK